MKIVQTDYSNGERVCISADLDDGDGWSWKLKNKKGTVHIDEYGMHVMTDDGDKVVPIEITKIKKLT
jgi:hypothetical protein